MKATLGLVHPRPAPCPRVLPGSDRTGGRRAPDRDVAHEVQRVTGQVVRFDVVVYVVIGPGDERVDLHQTARLVIRHDRCVRTLWRVDPLQSGDPRRLRGDVVVHRGHLAEVTAVL